MKIIPRPPRDKAGEFSPLPEVNCFGAPCACPPVSIGIAQICMSVFTLDIARRPLAAPETRLSDPVPKVILCRGPVTLVPSAEMGTAMLETPSPASVYPRIRGGFVGHSSIGEYSGASAARGTRFPSRVAFH